MTEEHRDKLVSFLRIASGSLLKLTGAHGGAYEDLPPESEYGLQLWNEAKAKAAVAKAEEAAKLRVLAQHLLAPAPAAAQFEQSVRPSSCIRCELRRALVVSGEADALAPLLDGSLGFAYAFEPGTAVLCTSRCCGNGRSELFDAVERGGPAVLRALLAWRPDPADVNDHDAEQHNMTPLMVAADLGKAECVAALLAAQFILLDAADDQHRTALSHALTAQGGVRGALVAQLIAAGANPVSLEPAAAHHGLPGRAGSSPLHRAVAVAGDDGAVCVRLLAAAAARRGRSLDVLASPGQPNTTALSAALLARNFTAATVLRFCGAAHFHLARTNDAQRHRALVPHLPPQVVPFFFGEAPPEWTPQLHRFCPTACRAAIAEFLRCVERGRRAAAASAHAAADEGAGLWRLPAPLLMRIVAAVSSAWCSSAPWPFEVDAFDARDAARPLTDDD